LVTTGEETGGVELGPQLTSRSEVSSSKPLLADGFPPLDVFGLGARWSVGAVRSVESRNGLLGLLVAPFGNVGLGGAARFLNGLFDSSMSPPGDGRVGDGGKW